MTPDTGQREGGGNPHVLDPASREWISRNLFDEVPMAISIISPDFRIVEGNRRFTEEYGEWRGKECYEVYKGRSERCKRCAASETFADGKIRTREEEGTYRHGGKSHYLVQMVPITQSDGTIPYVIEMSTDITQVKQLEHEKREAQRLAAVGETVAGIAHGIKNVLMGLEGGLYAVNTGIEQADDERIARGWDMVEENVTRISSVGPDSAAGEIWSTLGARRSVPSSSCSELKAFRRPPVRALPVIDEIGSAPSRMACLISRAVAPGADAASKPTTPETCGVAIDVPL